MAKKKATKKAAKKAVEKPVAAPKPLPPREFPLRPLAVVETSLGSFTMELLIDEAPVTASNYLAPLEGGFYEGLHVHRVVEDFVVQIGCPHSKDPKSELKSRFRGGPFWKPIRFPPSSVLPE